MSWEWTKWNAKGHWHFDEQSGDSARNLAMPSDEGLSVALRRGNQEKQQGATERCIRSLAGTTMRGRASLTMQCSLGHCSSKCSSKCIGPLSPYTKDQSD